MSSSALGKFRGVRVHASGAQSIPFNAYTALSFDVTDYDVGAASGGSWILSATKLQFPWTAKYRIYGSFQFDTANAANSRHGVLRINGGLSNFSAMDSQNGNSDFAPALTPWIDVVATAGDYLELLAYHDRGGGTALNVLAGAVLAIELLSF